MDGLQTQRFPERLDGCTSQSSLAKYYGGTGTKDGKRKADTTISAVGKILQTINNTIKYTASDPTPRCISSLRRRSALLDYMNIEDISSMLELVNCNKLMVINIL
jgi:hypothetical protein